MSSGAYLTQIDIEPVVKPSKGRIHVAAAGRIEEIVVEIHILRTYWPDLNGVVVVPVDRSGVGSAVNPDHLRSVQDGRTIAMMRSKLNPRRVLQLYVERIGGRIPAGEMLGQLIRKQVRA